MKFSKRWSGPSKVDIPMAPMIDIVFQLLIFFMLNLKIVSPEGNFNINMPIGPPSAAADQGLPEIKVGLHSDRDGNLTQITFGSKNLGNDDAAFEQLNKEILTYIGRPGNPLTKEVEVEIDADFETQYKYVVRAISKCTGKFDPNTKQIARYVEKIKFAAPHKPKT
ncbi:ExbD/TolR family protein [Schlesneria paludicola]|uniref:ExbD/TolR family protein n=1 Tax=Schlesneria paludicola TaxID=360056 RepID=UPI00029ABCFC|nr:biopolymer transporter ExbD [Schlesneria paludicola]